MYRKKNKELNFIISQERVFLEANFYLYTMYNIQIKTEPLICKHEGKITALLIDRPRVTETVPTIPKHAIPGLLLSNSIVRNRFN